MDAGFQAMTRIQSADANKGNVLAKARVVAPHGNPTGRATNDRLAFAAFTRRHDSFRGSRQQRHVCRFDQRIERERRTRLPLAPGAVAAVDN